MRSRFVLSGLLFMLVGAGLLMLGLSIPIHFRAVSPLILEEAGKNTPSIRTLADDFLDRGLTGPIEILNQVDSSILTAPHRRSRYNALLQAHPDFRLSGGDNPYFNQVLSWMPDNVPAQSLLPLLLPKKQRQQLLSFLQNSSNTSVHALLKTRELTGWKTFLPVHSAAGHPLDAAILTTALLEQSSALSKELSRTLREHALNAANGDLAELEALEINYISIVTLANRTNWTQLTLLLQQIPDEESLSAFAATLHQPDVPFPQLYAAALLSDNTIGLLDYLGKAKNEGWETLNVALANGSGALRQMIQLEQPLYHPPPLAYRLILPTTQTAFKAFAQKSPQLATLLKILALFGCGYALALALSRFIRVGVGHGPPVHSPMILVSHAISGIALAILAWILIEPQLLSFDPNAGGTLRINIASILPETTSISTSTEHNMLDQVTLIILLMFFTLQLIVFTFAMLKLKEIKNHPIQAELKLRLLDNEENLFDLGLYVGLGGTVGSLILVVMQLVDASLMAAYASTLFGILFVAILKVGFIRPARRRMILEADQQARS